MQEIGSFKVYHDAEIDQNKRQVAEKNTLTKAQIRERVELFLDQNGLLTLTDLR